MYDIRPVRLLFQCGICLFMLLHTELNFSLYCPLGNKLLLLSYYYYRCR